MAENGQQIFLFKFGGYIIGNLENESAVFSALTSENGSEIAQEEIKQEIKQTLPPPVSVEVEFVFNRGSIGWEGVVTIMDWMGLIAGVIDFATIFQRIIKNVINRAVNRRLSYTGVRIETQVTILPLPPRSEDTSPSPEASLLLDQLQELLNNLQRSEDTSPSPEASLLLNHLQELSNYLRIFTWLIIANLVLLIIIIGNLIYVNI